MAEKQDTVDTTPKFAPRDRQVNPERRGIRASLLFIGLGAVMCFGAVLWLGLFSQQDQIRLEISDIKVDETGDVELTGAVYRGQTVRGEPFEITAQVARERDNGIVDLSSPTAELHRVSGDIMNVRSTTGVYFPGLTEIDLIGDVVVTSRDTGLVMMAEVIHANLEDGHMKSDRPVRVENDSSLILAGGMQVIDRGSTIIFTNKPKMTLHNAGERP
ncbi:MAG: LPS export ABC transporter periplasmic protein LptC [Candidatus Puniceispirillaceae bacterium]|jgi:lipopolysaccharide export system protein LptC